MIFAALVLAMTLQPGDGGFPAVAAHAGTIHVVWQDDSEGNPEIYYTRSTGGSSFTAPLNLSRNPGISDLPRVIADKNTVSVVWSDTSPGTYQIMLAQSGDGGNSFGPARILSDGFGSSGPPDIACQDGRLFVVWDQTEDNGETRIIYWESMGSRRAIAGSERGFVPAIAVRGDLLIIAWHTDVDYKQRIYAVRSADSGNSFSERVLVSADFQRSVTPSVGIAPAGRSFIAWSDRTSGSSEIFLSRSDPGGQAYSTPKLIESPGAESIFPAIQVMSDDGIAMTWATRNSIIYAQISADGGLQAPARSLTISDAAGVPRLAIEDEGPIVVWRDWRAGRSRILISRKMEPGRQVVE